MTNEVKEAILMFIKHIRPDGYIYPFSYNESKRLEEIANKLEEDREDDE